MKKGTGKSFNVFEFLFASWSANILIFLNVFLFIYLKTSPLGRVFFHFLVLYPGNLLEGRVWCILTSGFLHSSWTHLGMNMLGIFIFARVVERQLGFIKTLFVYFGALAISMMFSTVIYSFFLHKNVAIVGASGAVMGLISAAMLLDPFSITYEMLLPIPTMIKGWIFFYADVKGFLGAERDGTSHLSHLCGFLSIALLVYFLSNKDKRMMRNGLIINILSFVLYLFLRRWFSTQGLQGMGLLS